MVVGVHPKRRNREPPIVTLKIERSRERVRLSGDLRSEDLDQVKTEIERCGTSAVLDVEEVALVEIGRASCRERVEISVVVVSLVRKLKVSGAGVLRVARQTSISR